MTRFERLFVWSGGVLFAGSIALCVWWYLFYLGQPRPRTGLAPLAYDAMLLTIFASHHSLFARRWVKRQLTPIPPHLRRSVYVWIASVLLIAVCLLWRTLGGELYDASGARAAGLVVMQLAGVAIAAWSVAEIDPLELAGIKAPDAEDELQFQGPYRLVRHPLYLGWIVAAFGTPHLTGDRLAFAILTSLYLVIAIPWEEQSLVQSYGGEYTRYQRQVRWRVIPFIY
jgi:protein-S-isoprenylcysteine O-methyltransferase Ste14